MSREQPCGRTEAGTRAAVAAGYLRAALEHPSDESEDRTVAAGNAVLAAIAAADAICCLRLGKRNRSDNHADAVAMLQGIVPNGKSLARDLQTVLSEKDAAHYGLSIVSEGRLRRILRAAERLVATADDLVRIG